MRRRREINLFFTEAVPSFMFRDGRGESFKYIEAKYESEQELGVMNVNIKSDIEFYFFF